MYFIIPTECEIKLRISPPIESLSSKLTGHSGHSMAISDRKMLLQRGVFHTRHPEGAGTMGVSHYHASNDTSGSENSSRGSGCRSISHYLLG